MQFIGTTSDTGVLDLQNSINLRRKENQLAELIKGLENNK